MFLLLVACNTKKEPVETPEKYKVTSPLIMDTVVTREYVAGIQSHRNIEIRAKVEGYLDAIHVDEGQQVRQGELLFTIRPREYEAELRKARAELDVAKLELQNARVLAEKNIIAPNELAAAEARAEKARAEEQLAELYVSYTEIRAPFDGTVDRLKMKVGSLVESGSLLTTLSDNRDVYAYFNVSEQEYLGYMEQSRSGVKQPVRLLLADNTYHKYPGEIQTVEAEFNPETGSIPFRASFPNPDLLLRHGETGKVQLSIPLKNVLVIPQRATYELQDKTYVYVVDAQKKVHSRIVHVLQKLSNLYIVDSGITARDVLLLEGVQYVKDDDRIDTEAVSPQAAIYSSVH
jgi:membrane fusion protein (multidrug efflux system)